MNVIYLTQVFEIGQDPGSERHFFFCRYLARQGHTVTAITSNVDYKRARPKLPDAGWRIRRQVEGVDIQYVYSYANFRGSFAKRFWYYLTYVFSTTLAVLSIKRPDVIYAVSTPLTVGLLGAVLGFLRRVPWVFEVTDVWPDAAMAVGVVQNKTLIRMAQWAEMLCYRRAAHVVALTEGIRDNIIAKGIPAEKVTVITNGVDPTLFGDEAEREEMAGSLRKELGLHDRFLCLYLGAHGCYNALPTILDAAEALRTDPRIAFVLIGDGDEKPKLEARARDQGLDNVHFLPPISRSEAPAALKEADAFLLPNRQGDFFHMNLPNKLFDFLVSERPILVAGHGESADLVLRAGAGRVVPAEDGAALAQAILELASLSPDERRKMGQAGRRYVLEHYNRENLSQIFLHVLEKAVQSRKVLHD